MRKYDIAGKTQTIDFMWLVATVFLNSSWSLLLDLYLDVSKAKSKSRMLLYLDIIKEDA